ncbi:MAG: 3-dehydroquinate synthase, partial [Pseudomonadota bacterium]
MSGRTVRVDLGERAYDIVIEAGALDGIGRAIAAIAPGARIGLVTDERVAATYREPVEARLREAGLSPAVIAVPPGEVRLCVHSWVTMGIDLLLSFLSR